MKRPWPVNEMTDAEFRAQGWAAVSRDADGHAMTSHAPFESQQELADYIAEEKARGYRVTILCDAPVDPSFYERLNARTPAPQREGE